MKDDICGWDWSWGAGIDDGLDVVLSPFDVDAGAGLRIGGLTLYTGVALIILLMEVLWEQQYDSTYIDMCCWVSSHCCSEAANIAEMASCSELWLLDSDCKGWEINILM